MQIGLCLPQLGGNVDRDGLRGFCEHAEELGFGSLWVQEHIFYPLNPVSGYSARPGLKVPDAYRTTLAALETLTAAAAWTTRPAVGTSILVAGLHRPVALAQRLSTIDLLSGWDASLVIDGRAIPDDQLSKVTSQGVVTFQPGPGKEFEFLQAGQNCVVATYWPLSSPEQKFTTNWCFTAT